MASSPVRTKVSRTATQVIMDCFARGSSRVFRSACLFGGGGGMALGTQQAQQKLREQHEGRFELCGAYDFNAYACKVYEYLTGCKEEQLDAMTITPGDVHRLLGGVVPDAVWLSPPCLPAHGPVLTPDGTKRIDSLRACDLVLTHKGRYRPVVAVGRHEYDGLMYGIRLAGTVDVQEFTAEHPVYVRRFWAPFVDGRQRQRLTMGEPQFMQASRVRKGDLVGFPIDHEIEGTAQAFVDSFGLTTEMTCRAYSGSTSSGYGTKLTPKARRERHCEQHTRESGRVIDLRAHLSSRALWFVLGVYVGDGYVRHDRNEVIFCVGAVDGELATRLRAALSDLGLHSYDDTENGPTNVKIHVHSRHLYKLAKSFGTSCETKQIPTVLFNLERPLVEALVDGYRAADGSDKNSPNGKLIWKIPSVSLELLRGTQRLLLRLGLWGGIHIAAKAGTTVIEGRTVRTSDRWEISVQEVRDKRGPGTFLDDGCVWVRVRSVKPRKTTETVWNLEVEEDNTFCAPMMATHNCKGSSKLLSSAKAGTEKYVKMNTLSYRGVLTLLDAFPGDEPSFLIFENVPNITTRARKMLASLRKLLKARGYVIHDGYHEARHVGDLAQRRKRWFMVARNPRKVPVFLYKPPHKKGKVCGDVLGELPLPNDPAGGPMHRLSDTSTINLLRLWAIPAGGDWRDLIQDGRPRRERFRRHHIEKWDEPSVTIGTSGSNGPCAVADPRTDEVDLAAGDPGWHHDVLGVLEADDVAPTVTGRAGPTTGTFSIADRKGPELARAAAAFHHVDRVTAWDEATGTVTAGASSSNGAPSVADPRVPLARSKPGFTSMDHVLEWNGTSRTITGANKPGSGAPSIADPRALDLLGGRAPTPEELQRWEREGIKAEGKINWLKGKYGVTGWDQPTRTVIGGEANGASGIADPRVAVDLSLPAGTFHHVDRVTEWNDATGTVTHAPAPSSGAPAVADPRVSLMPPGTNGKTKNEVFAKHEVAPWDGPTRVVIASKDNGAGAVADPRLDLLEGAPGWNHGVLGVTAPGDVSATVTGATRPTNGCFSYADPRLDLLEGERFKGSLGVLDAGQPASTITAEAAPSTGTFAYAAKAPGAPDLRPQAGNDDLHWGKYVVVPWDGPSLTVTGASRVGSGATSVADPRVGLATDSRFRGRWGVLSPQEPAGTVTGNARLHTGPFSIAASPPAPLDLVPEEPCYDAGYGVLSPDQPSRTVAGKCAPGCGAYAIADEVPSPVDLELGCEPRADAYGVLPFDRESATVTASFKVDNSRAAVADPRHAAPPYVVLSHAETKRIVDGEVQVPFAIVDPERPGEPFAIVDDLKKAPFRWVERVTEKTTKKGKVTRTVTRVRETVALVLISADGTWHRPLTTLELAILQAFPAIHNGKPLDFGVPDGTRNKKRDQATTAQREVVGNAVPPAVAKAMAEQMLLSLIVSAATGTSLGEPGTAVWVERVAALEAWLQAAGYMVVKGTRPMNFTTGEYLDDGALVWKRAKPKKRAKSRAKQAPVSRVRTAARGEREDRRGHVYS